MASDHVVQPVAKRAGGRTGSVDEGDCSPDPGRGRKAVVVLATYNERENLPIVLRGIWEAIDIDVVVVDDSSPDGTGQLADRIAGDEPRLTVIHRPGKAGLAGALFAGYAHAFERGYELAIEMDADLSHPPDQLPALVGACDTADVAIGSRLVPAAGWWDGRPGGSP